MILATIVSSSSTCMDVDPGVLAQIFADKEKFMKVQHIYIPSFYYHEGNNIFFNSYSYCFPLISLRHCTSIQSGLHVCQA